MASTAALALQERLPTPQARLLPRSATSALWENLLVLQEVRRAFHVSRAATRTRRECKACYCSANARVLSLPLSLSLSLSLCLSLPPSRCTPRTFLTFPHTSTAPPPTTQQHAVQALPKPHLCRHQGPRAVQGLPSGKEVRQRAARLGRVHALLKLPRRNVPRPQPE